MKNYYKTLGISQNSSKSEIKKAFRDLAIKYHPDKHQDESLAEKFKEINEAKQVLLDDLKKFSYDSSLAHFISESTHAGRLKNRRRRLYRRNYALVLIRESISNKYFLGVLFTVTILLTIAFLTIPAEEPVVYSPPENKVKRASETNIEQTQPVLAATGLPGTVNPASKAKKTEPPLESKTVHVNKDYENVKAKGKAAKATTKKTKGLVHNHLSSIAKHRQRHKVQTQNYISKKRLLTKNQMYAILDQIRKEKLRLASNSNCVQIIKTKTSNIANAFMLADFLKGYGYVISGREKMETHINGITIDAKDCVIVTIGRI